MKRIKEFLRKIKSAFVKSSNTYDLFYRKCKAKPDYFVENCLHIKNSHDDSNVTLKPYQVHVLQNVSNFNRTIFAMPRRSSKSLLLILSALHYATFNENVKVVVMSCNLRQTQTLFLRLRDIIFASGKFRDLFNSRYTGFKGQIGDDYIQFNNGSMIRFTTNINEPYDFLLLDEFAFFKTDTSKILKEIENNDKKVAIFSTPFLGDFNKLLMDTYNFNVDTGFVAMVVNFTETGLNKEEIVRNLGPKNFKKEFVGFELMEPL